MSGTSPSRLLSIGEFASATQLSAKALRLYDEQQLLRPARIDPVSGYRYYRNDQVATGRLIRTLRDMDLALAEVARIVTAEGAQAERLLSELAVKVDQRYAREKRAFQTALLLLRHSTGSARQQIEERTRPSMTVLVRTFTTDRYFFYERLRKEGDAAQAELKRLKLASSGAFYCRLLEPLSDDEAPVELLLPVTIDAQLPVEGTLRQLPAAICAVLTLENAHGADFSAPADAIFDWFDRHAYRAVDVPWLHRQLAGAELRTEILWAYESSAQR